LKDRHFLRKSVSCSSTKVFLAGDSMCMALFTLHE
jgi:hypothetical protein